MNNPEIFVDVCPYADRVDLRLRADLCTINGEVVNHGTWMKEPVFVEVEEGAIPPVAVSLSNTEAQALMDRLWKAGLRPTEGSGSAGALAATERHLKDMQTLVFKRESYHPETDPELYRKILGEE